MDTIECIKSRRACRRFLPKNVSMNLIADVIEAARYTPSTGNVQNWRVLVVRDEKKKQEIAKSCVNQMWIANAPVVLVVCDDYSNVERLYGERGAELYCKQNCAMFSNNILLVANAFGLGSCLVVALDEDALRRILKIPENIRPEAVIPVGYADYRTLEEPRRLLTEMFVFWEGWGNRRKPEFDKFPLEKHKGKLEKKTEELGEKVKERFMQKVMKMFKKD